MEPKFSFKFSTTKYDPVNAYWMAAAASLSYDEGKEIRKTVLTEWGMEKYNWISRKNTQCFVTSNTKGIIIAFRGTEEPKDILSDLEGTQVSAFGGKVHKGFYDAYKHVRTTLANQVKAHQTGKQSLWICGHSLGGAIAVIAAMDLKENGYNVKGIYTFGQPKVGNEEFISLYEKKLKGKNFRFAQANDKVPTLPPSEIKIAGKDIISYTHADLKIWVAPKDRLTLNYRRSKNFFNKLKSLTEIYSAHSSDNYVKALLKNIDFNPVTDSETIKEKPVLTKKDVKKAVTKGTKTVKKKAKETGKAAKKGINKAGKKIKKIFK